MGGEEICTIEKPRPLSGDDNSTTTYRPYTSRTKSHPFR